MVVQLFIIGCDLSCLWTRNMSTFTPHFVPQFFPLDSVKYLEILWHACLMHYWSNILLKDVTRCTVAVQL